jgi:hypothetical protein
MAASLWRKKLVLHRSLVEIFIGLSESPIMHAPVPRSREISSAQRGGDHSPAEFDDSFSPEKKQPERNNSAGRRGLVVVEGTQKEKKIFS